MMTRNSKLWISVVLATLVVLGTGSTASAQHLFRQGYGGRYYGHGYGPGYGPGYQGHGYGSHGSGYGYRYSPYYSRFSPQYDQAPTGKLKLEVLPQAGSMAQVYLDDALASEFKHKRTLSLAPGKYRIEVRKEGYQSQSRTVWAVRGETLKLHFILVEEPRGLRPGE